MRHSARAPGLFEARVVASYGRNFLIEDAAGDLHEAHRRGKRGDVVVGDRVRCRPAATAQAAIEEVAPRASLLMRADGARSKALAANADRIVVVFAPRPSFSERFIWRAVLAADAAAIVPLVCERSVLRLHGERAEKKLAHWRGVAIAACEQSGRSRLPELFPVVMLPAWLQALPSSGVATRWLLSLGDAQALANVAACTGPHDAVLVLSGPEGGLSPGEEALARRVGFTSVGLGPRILRADTAPLAVLACLGSMLA